MAPKRKAAASKSKDEDETATSPRAPAAGEAADSPLTEQEGSEVEEAKPPKKKRAAKKVSTPVVPLDSSLPINLTVPEPLAPFEKPEEGTIRIAAWNVSGLRASEKKGFSRYIEAEDADILVITETKTTEIKVDSLDPRYPYSYWGDHNKKGQGGTAIFSKLEPLKVVYGIHNGAPDLSQEDSKGRCVTLEFEGCYVVGTYVPNAGTNLKTLDEKKAWNRAFERYLRELDAKKPVVWVGDMNVVPTEKDVRNWKTNHNKTAGCTDAEIEGFHAQLSPPEGSEHARMVDVWRERNPDLEGHYSYYSFRFQCRSKGIGWRLDMAIVSERLLSKVKMCEMRQEIWGASDHIPIVIDIERAALTGSKEEGGSKEEKKVEDTKEEENEEKADETAK